MTKIVKIDTCSACPYKLMTPDFKRKCRIFGYKIIDVPITTIPDWCPLEDAPNQALDSDTKYSGNPDNNPRKEVDIFHAPML